VTNLRIKTPTPYKSDEVTNPKQYNSGVVGREKFGSNHNHIIPQI